jgi:hypothetical protein
MPPGKGRFRNGLDGGGIAADNAHPSDGPAGCTRPPVTQRKLVAGWSSLVARWAHNPKVAGSNPAPATKEIQPNPLETEGFVFLEQNQSNRIQPQITGQMVSPRRISQDFSARSNERNPRPSAAMTGTRSPPRLQDATRSAFTAPRMRTAGPGPRKRWRQTKFELEHELPRLEWQDMPLLSSKGHQAEPYQALRGRYDDVVIWPRIPTSNPTCLSWIRASCPARSHGFAEAVPQEGSTPP